MKGERQKWGSDAAKNGVKWSTTELQDDRI